VSVTRTRLRTARRSARLDQLARPLFAVEPTGEKRAAALAAHVSGALRPDAQSGDGLFLDEVLAGERGHPVLIAAVAAELGRRAGWEIAVYSSPTAWYAGLALPTSVQTIGATNIDQLGLLH
jgi:Transglutaminase-like superfamily